MGRIDPVPMQCGEVRSSLLPKNSIPQSCSMRFKPVFMGEGETLEPHTLGILSQNQWLSLELMWVTEMKR